MTTGTVPKRAPTEAIDAILAALDPEQRAAATLPDGPAQIIAPAGSGKTTTMIARVAVLLGRGVPPGRICLVTFNRAAAGELAERLARRLGAVPVEVRTLHALARQVLLDAGAPSDVIADRLPLLRAARRRHLGGSDPDPPEAAELDTWVSARKVEGRLLPEAIRPLFDTYEAMLRARGAIDFDDLVVGASSLLESDARLRHRWQARFAHLCVDEFQDVDAAQLRLVRLLAAPEDNLYVVGDDDQTIYAWRLADVRRILGFGRLYPAARRVMLATNYRCPPLVVAASARLVAVNRERFAKSIRAPVTARPVAGSLTALPTAGEGWADEVAGMARDANTARRSFCVLARTRSELMPVTMALVRAGVRHATAADPLVEARPVVQLVDAIRLSTDPRHPFHVLRDQRLARGWVRGQPAGDLLTDDDQLALDALLGWAAAFRTLDGFVRAYDAARRRIDALRDSTAPVELATVHAAKGREWETVVLIGFEADRVPNRRSMLAASDPSRALEEERRLAYVAVTRATRHLILAFDPARPSPFLEEMGLAAPPSA